MKRIISLALVLAMLLGVMPVYAGAGMRDSEAAQETLQEAVQQEESFEEGKTGQQIIDAEDTLSSESCNDSTETSAFLVWDFEDHVNEDGSVTSAEEYYGSILTHSNYNRGGKESFEIVSIDDGEPVRFGAKSLKLNYDFTQCGAVTEGACVGTTQSMEIPGTPTGIGVWVYAPEGVGITWEGDGTQAGFWLRGYVVDGTGTTLVYDFVLEPKAVPAGSDIQPGIYWTGWKYLEADLTKFTGPFKIQAGMTFRLMYVAGTKMGTKTANSIYFDNFQFVYGNNENNGDNPTEDEKTSGSVCYFSEWDEENQIAYFGPGDMLGSQVTAETDASFTENPTALLGQYVLVETKPRTDGDIGPDTLISVKAVESKTGTVNAADSASVTIDSETYTTPTNMTQPGSYVDQFVLYHLYNGSLVEVEILETIEGTLISWDEQTRVLNLNLDGAAKNPVVYTLSPLADEKTVSQLSSGLLLNSKVKCLTDCNCVVFYVELTESSFSKAIYHADSLLEDEVVNLNSLIRQINQYSPAVIVLNNSDVDDWAEAWDELTTFYDNLASGDEYLKRKFEQTDIYEAILLTALECSTSDDSAYAWGLSTVKKEVSFTKSVLSWVKGYVELEYNWKLATNMEISSMTEDQKEQLKSALQKALEEFGVMDLVDNMTESADILDDILKVASTAEDLVEKVSVYMELWYVSDSMAAVLDEMLLKIPNTEEYTPMRSALTFCRDMIEETNRDQFKKEALLRADFMVGGKFILSEGISFIWGKIKEKVVAQNPELNILLIAYKASHSLTNFLFNTDSTSEQLYKLKVVSRYTSYLESAILSIKKQYTENKTEENANQLLNAISLLNAFAVEECDIACDFASAVEKASMVGGNGTDTTLKEYATGTREFYIGLNVEAATHWVYHLCDDYPEIYPDYAELIDGNGGASKEVLEKALVVRITSDYIIECPVNVRVYNNNGALAANLCGDGTYVLGNLSAVQLGDCKFISIGNSEVYRIECDGYADGTMTVTIREYQGVEKIREAVFYDMEVTSDTVYNLNTKTNPLDNTIHTISLDENSIPADYDSGIEKCIEHTYNTPRFNWDADYSCDAVFICMHGDDKLVANCTVTSTTTPATETATGKTVYTATVDLDGQTYMDTRVVTIPPTNHTAHTADTTWHCDSTSHWHECIVCGEKMDVTRHSGGTATCTKQAECEICGIAYGDLAPHDYETAWTQAGEAGHWHVCKNCSAHDSVVPHVPGAAATATTAQTCTKCGFVIASATSHTHTADSTWHSNGTYHWHLCTSCGAWVSTSQHSYSSDTDTTCNVCGDTRAVKIETVPMYRLYNPNSGEHFYTGSEEERDSLVTAGWKYEGVAWNAPKFTGEPVYRVFNPNSGDHHYTMSLEEVEDLKEAGWQYENVAWNSAPADHAQSVPQYRLYNPNADLGCHHYTSSLEERQNLVDVGWQFEGIGWFGMVR